MKYILISFSLIFLLACSNNEVKLNTSNSIFISPDNIELSNYSGELIYFQVTNSSKHTIYLTPDISLFTRYNDKEYIVQKKNKFSIKPNISFSFSTGSKGSDFSNSLGIIIENDKEYFNYSQNEFIISSNSSKQIYLSIYTDNLYFQVENKDISINSENIYGYIKFYVENNEIKSIPILLNKQSMKNMTSL